MVLKINKLKIKSQLAQHLGSAIKNFKENWQVAG
jgi:hypothetical protein